MKRMIAAVAAMVLLVLAVFASGQTCSLTFEIEHDGQALNGGSLSVYLVGVAEEDHYVRVDALSDFEISFEKLDTPETAKLTWDAVNQAKLEGHREMITDGKVSFSDLEPGLYLVAQEEACAGYSSLSPFLITLPRLEDGEPQYDVTAKPKVELEPLPTESTQPTETEPTVPDDPELPQTGQLNWPIPVLSVGGACLFMLGWILRYGKREHHAA